MMWRARKLTPKVGVEVTDIDVSKLSDAEAFKRLRRAWCDASGVMVLRNQKLTPQQHVAFGRQFGDLYRYDETAIAKYLLPGYPEIYRVSNKVVDGVPQGRKDAGTYWHSDQSGHEIPPSASILYALEIPPVGGDTMFADQYQAYDALSDTMKKLLEPLKAMHSLAASANTSLMKDMKSSKPQDWYANLHPIVRTHPETGRKALFVNPGFTAEIDGLPRAESQAILNFLFAHIASPEFVYRHVWQLNDVVIWDNRCVLHYAVSNYAGVGDRLMHRVTIRGERPE